MSNDPPDAGSVEALVGTLTRCRALRGALAHHRYLQGAPAQLAPARADLPAFLAGAMASQGIDRPYTHQAEALDHLAAGRHVLTVTPTASGKSLIYQIPTLAAVARDPRARALYLFPYKALEQDQLAALTGLARAAGMQETLRAAIYDGDTPAPARRALRARPPHVLITNPDMLHMGLLAHHEAWREFFSRLALVVVDELHVYRGIFGSHMHHVMARLARVCLRHGSRPRFVLSSASIGNPGEHAAALLGVKVAVVERSGAPRAGRHVLFVNPSGGSPYTTATWLLVECARAGLRTIVFTKARRITELIASWSAGTAPDLAGRLAAYRAGYLPEERRAVERRLASGQLLGVISTSALEHGIDVDGLDVCVMAGYPGSISSAWQRIGRVGRGRRDALVVLVALPDALDQYFMAHPDEFFDRGFEIASTDPSNPVVASQHLVCAGSEIPLTPADREVYSAGAFDLVEPLVQQGRLVADVSGRAWYSSRRNPQREVSLRTIGASCTIVDSASGRTIGTVDGARAFAECHEGAIYLHQGRTHEVLELNPKALRAVVRRTEVDHFTQVMSEKETEILEVLASRDLPGFPARLGRLRVTQTFTAYVRRRTSDQQAISIHPLALPPVVYETVGLWWEVPGGIREEAEREGRHFMGSLHASEHAAISLFPLLALCDRGDLGGISCAAHPQTAGAAVFIYDGAVGGAGLAPAGFARIEELLGRTLRLLAACPCEQGCPSCIHSPRCGSGNKPLDKAGARGVLEELLAGRPSGQPRSGPPRRRAAPAAASTSPIAAPAAPGGRLLFLDVETQRSAEEVGGWSRIDRMGLALAVVYDEQEGAYRTYLEPDVDRLIADLLSAGQVIGFNVRRFDYVVLRGYRDAAFDRIPTCDMLEEIHRLLGFRISLNHLAEATLGEGKSADGLQSLEWFRQGRLDLIEQYCRKDVEVTRRLFQYGRLHRHLLYRDREGRTVRVPVSW